MSCRSVPRVSGASASAGVSDSMTSLRLRPSPACRSTVRLYAPRSVKTRWHAPWSRRRKMFRRRRAGPHAVAHRAQDRLELGLLSRVERCEEVLLEVVEVHRHRGLDAGEPLGGELGPRDATVLGAVLAG